MAHGKQHDPELKRQVIKAVVDGEMSQNEAADRYKIPRPTIQNWVRPYKIKKPKDVGAPPPVGTPQDNRAADGSVGIVTQDKPLTLDELYELFGIDRNIWVPQVLRANQWEGFYKLPGENGGHRKVKLWQSRAVFKRILDESFETRLLSWIRKHAKPLPKGSLKKRAGVAAKEELNLVWGLWDTHLGMYAWNAEVREDYDLSIAVKRVNNSIDDMILWAEKQKLKRIYIPIGNDFLHFDTVRQTTTYGEHFLDTDSRFAKVYVAALECLAYMVERALEVADEVVLIYVPGNHDHLTSFTLVAALNERFRNDPRIIVDMSPDPHKAISFGTTCIGLHHGKDLKRENYGNFYMSHPDLRDSWARATWKEIQIGHTHQRRETTWAGLTPHNGYLVRTNPTLSNVDFWHHTQGFIGEPVKSCEAWLYAPHGYIGSWVTWARDD